MWPSEAIDIWREQIAAALLAESPSTNPQARSRPTGLKRTLEEMDQNITPTRQSKARRLATGKRSQDAHDFEVLRDDEQEEAEDNPTPRPPAATTTNNPGQHPLHETSMPVLSHGAGTGSGNITGRDARSLSGTTESSNQDSNQASSTQDSTTSGKRRRDGSPTKSVVELQYARYPLSLRDVDGATSLKPAVQGLFREMESIAYRRNVLHRRHRHWTSHFSGGDDAQYAATFTSEVDQDERRDALGTAPDLQWATRLLIKARLNEQLACSEAQWNCSVHAVILDDAIYHSPFYSLIDCQNVTTARIHPFDLVPDRTKEIKSRSKKVDFAICLEAKLNIGKPLFQTGIQSLNCTDYNGIRYRPVAVSIETKAAYSGGAEATAQLCTWAQAQIALLRRMLYKLGDDSATIITLPLVMVVGHEWRIYFIEDGGDRATLWKGPIFGSTNTLLGMYQVLAGVQLLAEWAEKTYRPWFESNILTPLLSVSRGTDGSR